MIEKTNRRLSEPGKRSLLMVADTLTLPIALWIAVALRYGDPYLDMSAFWFHFTIVAIVGVLAFRKLELYRAIIRYIGPSSMLPVIKGVTCAAVSVSLASYLMGTVTFPRSAPIIFWFVAILMIGGGRILLRAYFYGLFNNYLIREPVAIYGAGDSGAQLAIALLNGDQYVPVAFLDDKRELHRTTINGIKVYAPVRLDALIELYGVKRVLLAMPELDDQSRRGILNRLARSPVQISILPRIQSLVDGSGQLKIREVDIGDILGREVVPPDEALLASAIDGKNILITGAAGTIGSEIARQILGRNPSSVLLYDNSELGLYHLDRELSKRDDLAAIDLTHNPLRSVNIIPLLGSVLTPGHLLEVLRRFSIDTVYHAAAYKHVPLVEHNIIEGVRNNVLGTWLVAKAVEESGVKELVLISSDKAVRPTNVMGASKRLAELIVQGFAGRRNRADKRYCIVRFGNVLKSSGSVIPLFESQIRRGGPVTVTHPDAQRYFMTSKEAAELVIQAAAMSLGGEIFVLEMGEQVRIRDLAEKMIHLHGKVAESDASSTEENPEVIKIVYTGLRPGEKLSEELVIGEDVVGSRHPKILKTNDKGITWDSLQKICSSLEAACRNADYIVVRKHLEAVVEGYTLPEEIVDPSFSEVDNNSGTDSIYTSSRPEQSLH